jgi:cyclopropane fatty-acyl-phospholipid synthase-like methyltransferase
MQPETFHVASGFSAVYAEYEQLSQTDYADLARRNLIRRHLEQYLRHGDSILEINAGSGIDALYFAQKGHAVLATDISAAAAAFVQSKIAKSGLKLRFSRVGFADLDTVSESFDHIFSNFGGLNCTSDLPGVFKPFSKLVKAGGFVTLVVMPKYNPWEIASGIFGNKHAFRRLKKGCEANVGGHRFPVFYHTPRQIKRAFSKDFRLLKARNIGTFSPSGHAALAKSHPRLVKLMMQFDEAINSCRFMPAGIGDYVVMTFQKIP